MTLSENPGALKKFRRTAWKFLQTFQTPLKNLPAFMSTIVRAREPWKTGCLTIERAVFEPRHLIALLAKNSIPARYERGVSLTAAGQEEIEALLCAVLGDWIDFIFVRDPKSFAIYADHDEYTTFYARTRSNLNRVTETLMHEGFQTVPDYERQL
jgi:hypothetical protein